jgi:hypothetical protein
VSSAALTPQQIAQAEINASKEKYIHRVLDAFDQFVASAIGVQDDQTISSASAIAAHRKVWYSVFAKGLNAGLDLIQASHGEKAQAGDIERAKEVIATDSTALKDGQ